MCGILGFASARADVPDAAVLDRMRDTMSHRGPDDAGSWIAPDRTVALAHRRLAVIAPTPEGHQPMATEDGRLHLVFNGEIYNYRELREELRNAGFHARTATDTEIVLLAYRAWGSAAVEKLVGMFAFAIHDADRGVVFLARDRAGEKPLFYRHDARGLAFASELKALLARPGAERVLDLDALDRYLTYGYVSHDACLVRGYRKLPQGHAAEYDIAADRLKVAAYWSLPDPSPVAGASEDELADRLETVLADACRRNLVADVPVGVLLSGGLDSSLVTAFAARSAGSTVRTFTVSFAGHGRFDEGPYARIVSDHFGTDHTELVAEAASVEIVPELARVYDEPIGDHAIVPTYMLSKRVREHVTVALGGDGGDEVFGGYQHYSWLHRFVRLRRFVPGAIRSAGAAIGGRVLPPGFRGRNHVVGLTGGPGTSIAHVNVYFDRIARARLLAPELRRALSGGDPEAVRRSPYRDDLDLVDNAVRVDFATTMVDAYLVKVDRASMAHSLEVRAPFLDRDVVEFGFRDLPSGLRATDSDRKILLRKVASRVLPAELDLTRKQGFTMPLEAWFRGPWGEYMGSVLRASDAGLFDPREVDRLIRLQRYGCRNAHRLFALTMLELWRREYGISLP